MSSWIFWRAPSHEIKSSKPITTQLVLLTFQIKSKPLAPSSLSSKFQPLIQTDKQKQTKHIQRSQCSICEESHEFNLNQSQTKQKTLLGKIIRNLEIRITLCPFNVRVDLSHRPTWGLFSNLGSISLAYFFYYLSGVRLLLLVNL